ncbi:arylalkylamine N-acetyltransferase 1-like [Diabrotica undecimpunctata]|uniref:arylalkylamine N-acetyltransferase 1-like n=1 Tax=Diabrotica undecimpunctata TaxID=50387 RepID=UPI003B636294
MEYVPIPSSRFEEVLGHLRQSFPDEPLNASVGLSLHGKPCPLLEKYDLLTMQEGMSIMALDTETNEIAGVLLNGICRRGDIEKSLENMKTIDSVPYHRIFGLLNGVNKEIDLFTRYNVEEIFELRILSVEPKYRGRGLAKELFSRSEGIARKHGLKLMKVDATSLFTQKICEAFGFESIKSVCYADYKDENGRKMYDTESPHDYYKVMVKQVPSRKDDD